MLLLSIFCELEVIQNVNPRVQSDGTSVFFLLHLKVSSLRVFYNYRTLDLDYKVYNHILDG